MTELSTCLAMPPERGLRALGVGAGSGKERPNLRWPVTICPCLRNWSVVRVNPVAPPTTGSLSLKIIQTNIYGTGHDGEDIYSNTLTWKCMRLPHKMYFPRHQRR